MEQIIPFNKPFLDGKEAHYLYQAVYSGKISGNSIFTKKCYFKIKLAHIFGFWAKQGNLTDSQFNMFALH